MIWPQNNTFTAAYQQKMTQLDKRYWQERYRQKQTGWDAHTITQPLKAFIDQWNNRDAAVLIPGCGHGHEAIYLLEMGFTQIKVIDIAEEPLLHLRSKASEAIQSGKLTLVCADFWEWQGQYDLILEQTFFCALDPALRAKYAMKMHALLKPGALLAGVLFQFPLTADGPPFGGNAEEYTNYFSPYFDIKTMEACYNSIAPRAGRELFIRLQKPRFESI